MKNKIDSLTMMINEQLALLNDNQFEIILKEFDNFIDEDIKVTYYLKKYLKNIFDSSFYDLIDKIKVTVDYTKLDYRIFSGTSVYIGDINLYKFYEGDDCGNGTDYYTIDVNELFFGEAHTLPEKIEEYRNDIKCILNEIGCKDYRICELIIMCITSFNEWRWYST